MKTADQLLAQLDQTASGLLEKAFGAEPQLYWDEEVAALEDERIFRKDWICVGLANEIPDAGDYITFTIAGDPVFSIRDNSGEVKTYSNVCRHRMMQLDQYDAPGDLEYMGTNWDKMVETTQLSENEITAAQILYQLNEIVPADIMEIWSTMEEGADE